MPLDAARWSLEISAIDKTASAFSSATARMQAFSRTSATAARQSSDAFGATSIASRAAGAGIGLLTATLAPLAAGFTAAALANKVWQAGMKAADIGEQAEQIGLTTDALQAFRFQAAQNGVEVEQLDTAMMRLTASMGAASKGGEEQINLFNRLGVKLLDAQGELRSAGDVLPEVARGILSIGSESQRNATLIELFGRSGSRMVTMLKDWAGGNEALIASAKRQGGVLDADVISKWDAVSDSMKRAELAANTTFAALGAPIATAALEHFNNVVAATKDGIDKLGGAWRYVRNLFTNDSTADLSVRQDTLRAQLENLKDSTDALDVAKVTQIKRDLAEISNTLAGRANVVTLPPISVTPSAGVSNPPTKAGGGSSAQPKVVDETAKAMEALAKFMKEANDNAEIFIANQEVERQSLFMTKEAAGALRIEQDLLNRAKSDGIVLSDENRNTLSGLAAQMAASAEKTRQLTEMFDLAKDVVGGFFSDFTQSLRQGQSLFEALGNAGMNALNKIADKLMQMAIDDLVGKAFGGGKGGGGGGGGFLGGIFGSLFGGSGGGGTGVGTGTGYTYANGAAFAGGNVIPFARGGVVGRPTLFPMANGMGLMGEAGPEAVMPLRRGPGGRLGVEASGAGGGGVVVNIHNYAKGTEATAKQSKGPGGEMQIDVIVEMVEGKMAGRMARGQGSLGRVIEGTYGVQRQGR